MEMDMKLKIMGKRLLVKVPAPEKTTKGGLVLVSSSEYTKTSPVTCEVVALGTDLSPEFKVGQSVLVNRMATFNMQYAVHEPNDDDENFVIIMEPDVFAIIEDSKKDR